jgi:hypothetical protein
VKTSRLAIVITASVIAAAGLVGIAVGLGGCEGGCPMHAMTGGAASPPADGAAKTSGSIVNARCPIMGGKATEALTRDYNGQKVGFCCGGCPSQWDKLTDAQKDAKLAAMTASAK